MDHDKRPILGDTQIRVGSSHAILEPVHGAFLRQPPCRAVRFGWPT